MYNLQNCPPFIGDERVLSQCAGKQPNRLALDFPNVIDCAHTMKFIAAAVESSRTGTWVDCRLGV